MKNEGGEVLPPRNRQFKMKEQVTTKVPEKEAPRRDPLKDALRRPAISDAEALQRAYSSQHGVYTYGGTALGVKTGCKTFNILVYLF